MVAAPPHPSLYQVLESLPEGLTGEILNGHLIASPRPGVPHGIAVSGLGALLGGLFQFGSGGGPGGWWFIVEPELHLAGNVLVPDLAGWRKERLPSPPRAPFMTLAPDWVCEGLSASTEVFDRGEKMPAYAGHGVLHAWLLDAEARSLEVFRNELGIWRPVNHFQGPVKVRAEPFQLAELDLGQLWLPDAPGNDTPGP